MSIARQTRGKSLAWLVASFSCACGGGALNRPVPGQPPGTELSATSIDDSVLCRTLADSFIGLPRVEHDEGERGQPAVSAGRWWVRRCSAKAEGAELQVSLQGPGWYWVDRISSGIRVQQQVPFEVSLQLRGRLRESATNGVLSIWFVPSAEPQARVDSPDELNVEAVSGWGKFLSWVPAVSPARRAAQQFRQELTKAFTEQARSGATLTYDLRSGQADSSLGQLPPGTAPRRAFGDEPTWAANDRLLLAPSGAQVLGPIDPGALTLNLIVEQGPGLAYRALCQQDLRDNYPAIRSGAFAEVPESTWVGAGTVTGLGERTARLQVERCKFYLVLASSSPAYTLAAVRVAR